VYCPLFLQQSQAIPEKISNSHYKKSRRIMGKMKFKTIEHKREKMLPAIKINRFKFNPIAGKFYRFFAG